MNSHYDSTEPSAYSRKEIEAHEARKRFQTIASEWEIKAVEHEGQGFYHEKMDQYLDALASFQTAEYAKYQHLFFRALAEYAHADEMKACAAIADESMMWDYLDEEHKCRKWADRYAERAETFLADHPNVQRTLEAGE